MGTWTIDRPDRRTFDGEVKRLDVHLMQGRLNVVGTDGPARIEVTAIGAKPIDVTLDDDGTLTVVHQHPPKWTWALWWLFGRKYRADVSVAVPQAVPATLNVVSGTIVASTLRAGARVDVTSGRMTLLGLDGRISGRVVSGSIEALSIGGELDLETVSGEIVIADSTVARVRAKTISGSITCDLDNPKAHEVRLDTTSGEIVVRVPEDADLDVDINATSGRVSSAFPQVGTGGFTGARYARGRLGAGNGRLTAYAVSGNISLLSRPAEDAS
jgi:DUF4097 and DUF4098 domain-containing protein YvlB